MRLRGKKGNRWCVYVCGEAGHIVPNCPKRAKKDKQVGDIRAVQVEEIGRRVDGS